MRDVQIVDQQQIDARKAETLKAVLKTSHHAAVAVVEVVLKFLAAAPEAVFEILRIVEGVEQPADLGREHIVSTRPTVESATEAVLALPAPVPWGSVVIADAGVPCRLQRGGGIGVLDYDGQISEPGAAEAKLCDLNVGAANFAADKRIHGRSSSARESQRDQPSLLAVCHLCQR